MRSPNPRRAPSNRPVHIPIWKLNCRIMSSGYSNDVGLCFVSVVDAGGLTRARSRVHRTQSAISQQIKPRGHCGVDCDVLREGWLVGLATRAASASDGTTRVCRHHAMDRSRAIRVTFAGLLATPLPNLDLLIRSLSRLKTIRLKFAQVVTGCCGRA
jgi:hypothetical protein